MPLIEAYTVLPKPAIEAIAAERWPPHALRLFMGVMCVFDESMANRLDLVPHIGRLIRIPCARISKFAAPVGARDNRWMKSGGKALQLTRYVESISIQARAVELVLSHSAKSELVHFNRTPFGKVLNTDLNYMRTPFDGSLLLLVSMAHNMKYPHFEIPLFGEDPERADDHPCMWLTNGSRWLDACERASREKGYMFLVFVEQNYLKGAVSKVYVKMQTPNSKWKPETLYKSGSKVDRVFEITPGSKRRRLTRAELVKKCQ